MPFENFNPEDVFIRQRGYSFGLRSIYIYIYIYIYSPAMKVDSDLQYDLLLLLQSECIEKYLLELCSKYDREYDFDVII